MKIGCNTGGVNNSYIQSIFLFIWGFSLGLCVSYYFIVENVNNTSNDSFIKTKSPFDNRKNITAFEGNHRFFENRNQSAKDMFHEIENKNVANKLEKKIRVLCWIMTSKKYHKTRAMAVKNTWGQRCNILLFMSSSYESELPTVVLPVKDDYKNLWSKTKEAFKYVYKHHQNDADWFLKADDDTFVVLENLRFMLMSYNFQDPLYFGCLFKKYVKNGYMSGGAGYVLSHNALERFVNKALPNATLCSVLRNGSEDIEIGKCLQNVDVLRVDTRDHIGRGRFFPLSLNYHIYPGSFSPKDWFHIFTYYKVPKGPECCSNISISFHYVTPSDMYTLNYLIYHFKPFGISYEIKIPSSLRHFFD